MRRCAVTVLATVLSCTGLLAQAKSEPLSAAVLKAIDDAVAAGPDPRSHAVDIWRRSVSRLGTDEPLLEEIDRRIRESEGATKLALTRLSARLLRIRGDLRGASAVLRRITPEQESVADILAKAEVLDAQGSDKQAVAMYDRLLTRDLSEALRNRVLLRKALMTKATAGADGKTPLAAFAAEDGRTVELKNQAATILALKNEQKDAIRIFTVRDGKGSARFRQEVRLAEWAIEASAWKEAQDFAWSAVESARLKRDRRYALTILVEAYRRADDLDGLIKRFRESSGLSDEARQVWIDLLRETGNVEEALRLFRESADGTFTNDMRRQLLEMCREMGQEKVLVEAYTRLIKEQPRFIEWREGLARYYLEQGARDEAEVVWADYLDVAKTANYRLAAAGSAMKLGLDDLSIKFARACVELGDTARDSAFLFLFELHNSRGNLERAGEVLEELDGLTDPASPVRMHMADAYARLGDKRRSARTLENLRKARAGSGGLDAEMKLAFLYSEIGEEEKAQTLWLDLWRRVNSIPRRRYVEDRLMTVAARLGTLAGIAVDLESRLLDGTADDRDAGLLVQIYTRVNDPVSATEIIEEYMKRTGKAEAEVLAEKARIFLSCHDYYNYEQAVRRLIEVDEPENKPDHLRQLAMSILERGQREEARKILNQLKADAADTASDEFEAGVLSIAGLREEALKAYRRSLAKHPERVDTWLLVSNTMKELGQFDMSAGMFQYLAATAEKDDLFTIAIDGILNMRDGRQNRGAPDRLVRWARRLVMERLAARPDKLYLYQLVADLSEELNDTGMYIRSLKAALPIAGEQRTAVLRELMTKAKPGGRRPGGSFVTIIGPGGVVIRQGGGSGGGSDQPTRDDHLMFGRRLLGQGELVPPGVYLELGEAFLAGGEVVNAARTFNAASRLPEFDELQRKIAASFEAARYPREALRVYERILTVEGSDLALMAKVAQLHEQLGRDDLAEGLYRRALDLYLARQPFAKTVKKETTADDDPFAFYRRNVDASEQQYPFLVQGLLATLEPGKGAEVWFETLEQSIKDDIGKLGTATDQKDREQLEGFPRLQKSVALLRRIAVAHGDIARIDAVDRAILGAFPKDKKILESMVRFRLNWGYVSSARKLIDASGRPAAERGRLALLVGGGKKQDVPGLVPVGEAAGLVLPMLVAGDADTVRTLLERIDLSEAKKGDEAHLPLLVSTADFLDESEIALGLLRHWLSAVVTHQAAGNIYSGCSQILASGRRALKPAQFKSLVEGLVQTVVAKPDKFSVFIQRLPQLQKEIGSDLLTGSQVQELIESRLNSNDQMIYGIPQLFVFVPADDRATVLRGIWNKIPKTQRALFILMLVPQLDEEVDSSFSDFLVGSFKQSIRDVEDPDSLKYTAEDLVGDGDAKVANVKTIRGIYEALLARDEKDVVYRVGLVLCDHQLGRKDEARKAGRAIWKEIGATASSDYRVNQAISRLLSVLQDDIASLMTVLDEIEKKQGKSVPLTNQRLNLVARQKNPKALSAALKKAAEQHPNDAGLRQRWINDLRSRGLRVEAAEQQAELLRIQPTNARHKSRLESDWTLLRHPINALAARHFGDEKKPTKAAPKKSSDKKPRTPVASPLEIKKALDAGNEELARQFFRRLWRAFPPPSTGNRVIYAGSVRSYGRSWTWPADPPKVERARKPIKRSRGGYPDSLDKKILDQPKKRELEPGAPKPARRKTLHEVLVDTEFGEREMLRNLRSLDSYALQQANTTAMIKELVEKEVERHGLEPVIAGLLAKDREGTAGKIEYGKLFVLLEESAKAKDSKLEATLESLMQNVNAKDTGQLRRMARLFARMGQIDKAAVLWRWCANVSGGGYGVNIDHSLLNEVIESLEGETRDRIVEAILLAGAPSDDDIWNQDYYYNTVLSTWLRIGGPEVAYQRGKPFLKKLADPARMPSRDACKLATYILARAGDHDTAIKCLEIAYCKLTPPESGLQYPWMRSNWTSFGYGGTHDFRRMFPQDTDGWKDAVGWFSLAADQMRVWIDAERMSRSLGMQGLAVLTVRLHENGAPRKAAALIDQVRELAGDKPSDLLWVADVARRIGKIDLGDDIERRLLDEGRLHPERVPEVVARILESEGAVAALAAGEKATAGTLHPDLLRTLVRASWALGDVARAAYWKAMIELSVNAEAALHHRPKN